MMKNLFFIGVTLFAFEVSATDFASLPEISGRSQKIKSMSRIEASLQEQQRVKVFDIALSLAVSPKESLTTRGASDAALFKKISPAVVLVATKESVGSGAVISSDGYIVTNWHVIAGNKEVGVMFKPIQEGKKLSSDDFRKAEIVRVNQDGTVPAGNPFVGRGDALPEILSLGHRNPQGATLGPDGRLWMHEHGPQGGDEINVITPGLNYGWPVITYGERYGGGRIGEGISANQGEEPFL
jgi:hypothetical protein